MPSIPWGDVTPPGSEFEVEKFYNFTIESAELTTARKSGNAMVAVMYRCNEPDEGAVCFENYTIGSDGDPKGEDPQKLLKSYGLKLLKQALEAAQVKLHDDLEKTLTRAVGKSLQIVFAAQTDKDTKEVRIRASKYYPVGTAKPGTSTTGKSTTKSSAPVAAAGAKKKDDDDDDAPAAKPAPAKKADYSDDDD